MRGRDGEEEWRRSEGRDRDRDREEQERRIRECGLE